jgi:membrane-associated phospholipid phosphatase
LLTSLSVAAFISGEYIHSRSRFNLTVDEIEGLNRSEINSFDRPATHYWNTRLNNTSDVFAWSMSFLPALVMLPGIQDTNWEQISTVGLMYLQVFCLTRGLTNITKSGTQRIRPYLYNTSLSPEERHSFQGNEAHYASTSFFSGHTSITFASAVFLSKMYADIHSHNKWSYIIWGSSLAAAGFTAYCRVRSGEHFTSDVLAGAVVGSVIGYFIPVLHKKKNMNTSLNIMPNGASLVFSY